jgi:ABC-type glutathione transport system ATPase component
VVDPAGSLSRILATMQEPELGTVALLERNVYRLDYGARQRMRARIGFVHGYGGLLSNRNIRENIALPVSVHGKCGPEEEIALVDESLRTFGLKAVEEMKPHEVDGATRWSVCLARALVLRPEWLVLEGIGSWEMDRGRSTGWKILMEYRDSEMSTAICLPRQNPGFQSWFEKKGGMLIFYERADTPEQGRSR